MTMSGGSNLAESKGRIGGNPPRLETIRIGLAALAAAGLSLYFFSPRYVLWRLLGTPVTPPELVRAGDALRQVAHPLVHIDSRVNSVLEWRLLFPMLGHLLRLPDVVYLALPHLGALIALGFVVALARRHGLGWPRAIACAAILATSDWFFVSVGWLGYFDSWCILALLLVAFAQRKWIALAAILAAPWVDERFVVALPLCLVLRAMPLGGIAADAGGRIRWRHLFELCLALLPWLLVRAAFYFWRSDDVTSHHLKNLATANGAIRPISYLAGLWEGARWGWLAVVALVGQNWRAAPRWCAAFILVLAATSGRGPFPRGGSQPLGLGGGPRGPARAPPFPPALPARGRRGDDRPRRAQPFVSGAACQRRPPRADPVPAGRVEPESGSAGRFPNSSGF